MMNFLKWTSVYVLPSTFLDLQYIIYVTKLVTAYPEFPSDLEAANLSGTVPLCLTIFSSIAWHNLAQGPV